MAVNEKKIWSVAVQKRDKFHVLGVDDSAGFREEALGHLGCGNVLVAAVADGNHQS